jgi:hypothetical protein
MAAASGVPHWKIVLAAVLDFFTVFFVVGYLIGRFSGMTTSGGFELTGLPALLLFVIIVAYFVIGTRYAGGTLWQRILKTRA